MNPRFISTPPLAISDEPEQWILTGDYVYQSALPESFPSLVTVPAGFVTDLASIPRIARLAIPKNGRHRKAAVIHDYLCRLGLNFSRRLADRIFLEAMKVCGVSAIQRRLMYWAVAANTTRMRIIGKAR